MIRVAKEVAVVSDWPRGGIGEELMSWAEAA
jgi:hypothetical protein